VYRSVCWRRRRDKHNRGTGPADGYGMVNRITKVTESEGEAIEDVTLVKETKETAVATEQVQEGSCDGQGTERHNLSASL
jgi:hypothetical protein